MKERGQSLVEMVLVAPLLVMILLAVFEVGVILRNYYTLTNLSRELARTAARVEYIRPVEDDPDRGLAEIAGRVAIDAALPEFVDRGTVFLTYTQIETNFPCNPAPWLDEAETIPNPQARPDPATLPVDDNGNIIDYWPNCDCEDVTGLYYADNVIEHYSEYTANQYRWPPDSGYSALLYGAAESAEALADAIIASEQTNCRLMRRDGFILPRGDSQVVAEVIYDSYQLFGFPFLSNRFTDPIQLRAFTVMRVPDAQREVGKFMDR